MNRWLGMPSNGTMRTRALLASGVFAAAILGSVASAIALDKGDKAPEIGLEDPQGRHVSMAKLRGKVVVVDFWASWCDPCKQAMPVLDRLYNEYKDDGLVVVGVNVDRDRGNMAEFLETTPVSFPVVNDGDHDVAGRYEPPKMPSTYVVDKRGVVRRVQAGYSSGDAEKLEKIIKSLL